MGLPIKYEHIFLLSLSNARSIVKFYGRYALLYQNISLRYSNSFCLLEFRPKQFCFLGSHLFSIVRNHESQVALFHPFLIPTGLNQSQISSLLPHHVHFPCPCSSPHDHHLHVHVHVLHLIIIISMSMSMFFTSSSSFPCPCPWSSPHHHHLHVLPVLL